MIGSAVRGSTQPRKRHEIRPSTFFSFGLFLVTALPAYSHGSDPATEIDNEELRDASNERYSFVALPGLCFDQPSFSTEATGHANVSFHPALEHCGNLV